MKNILILLSLVVLTSGCSQAQQKATIGAALGSITGQAVGHNTNATLIGAGAGGLLGYLVGNEGDKNRSYSDPDHQNTNNSSNYRGRTQESYQGPNSYSRVYDNTPESVKYEYTTGGHWEVRTRRVWLKGYEEEHWVEPMYGLSDPSGNTLPNMIRKGYYRTIRTPGSWSVKRERIWVPDPPHK